MKAELPQKRAGRTALFAIALAIQGCGGCDLVGCVEGLLVSFDSPPAAPWKAELFVDGVLQPEPTEARCDGTRECPNGVLFRTFARTGVSVRITTSTGERTTLLPQLSYDKGQGEPNWCDECRGMATASVPVPE